MSKPLIQYDLPCYPDWTPRPFARWIVNVVTEFVGRKELMIFIGGGGVGCQAKTPKGAIQEMHTVVADRLQAKAQSALKQAEYYLELRARWQANPEQFRVDPS